mmetsp:Transcript_26966/g.87118  ORF Transcript_26966/g.87118 Transcript_26966/m.87118 type:complete len:275 (-) Transcript_26966:925-1749(-)
MSRGGVPHLLANHRKKTLPAGAPYPAAATLSAQQRGAHAAASSGDAALAHACSSRQKAGSPDSGTASAAISSARSASTVGFTPASIIAPADRAASTRETYPSHCARVWPDACAAASRAAQSGGGSSSFPPAAGSGSSPSSTSHWYREQNTIAPNPVREPRARAESSPMSHAAVPAVCSSPAPDASRAPTGVSGLWTSDGGAAPSVWPNPPSVPPPSQASPPALASMPPAHSRPSPGLSTRRIAAEARCGPLCTSPTTLTDGRSATASTVHKGGI